MTSTLKELFEYKLVSLKIDTILDEDDEDQELTLFGDLFEKESGQSMSNIISRKSSPRLKESMSVALLSAENHATMAIPRTVFSDPVMSAYLHALSFEASVHHMDIDYETRYVNVWLHLEFSESDLCSSNHHHIHEHLAYLIDMSRRFKEMQAYYEKESIKSKLQRLKENSLIKKDMLCMASYEDGVLYRAVIERVDYRNMTVTVRYLDYGNQQEVEIEK
jgi:hypothetical protein